jgi:hypothetical protein
VFAYVVMCEHRICMQRSDSEAGTGVSAEGYDPPATGHEGQN